MAIAAAAPIASPTSLGRVAGAPCSPSFGALLEQRASRAAPPLAAPEPGATRLGATAARALEGIEAAQTRLDGVLAAARSGRTFTPRELMALQGEAYRYAQTVELSAKLVEQGTQAVRRALDAQV